MYKIELMVKLIILLFMLVMLQTGPSNIKPYGYAALAVAGILIIGEFIYSMKKSKKKE